MYAVQKGFSLIEGIVALFILSVVAASTLQWVSQASDTAIRLKQHAYNNVLDKSLNQFAKVINPSETATGTIEINSQKILWSSSRIDDLEKYIDVSSQIIQPLILYRVSFSVLDEDGIEIRQYQTIVTGYKKPPTILL